MNRKLPVLVVEDDARDLEVLLQVLDGAGISSVTARDGETAKVLLGQRPFSAVLLNLSLPGIPGIALIGWLQAGHPHIPIAVITGSDNPKDAMAAVKAGAIMFFAKPYTEKHNASVVRLLAVNQAIMEKEARMTTRLKNPLRWLYGLIAGFIGGAFTALDSSLALMIIAPKEFNLHEGLQKTLLTALILAALSGAKCAAAYLKQSPLPPLADERDGQPEMDKKQ